MQSKAPSERNIVYMEIKQAGAKTYYIEGNTYIRQMKKKSAL